MNGVERYLQRATRGLWGQKKRDAQAELRGAIEDKVYRARLLGQDEAEAVASALRDLGSPAAIARELGEVHTMPQMLKVLALVGVAGVLGLQAAAQVPVVTAVPDPTMVPNCIYEQSILERMSAPEADRLRQRLAEPGGQEKLEAECRAYSVMPAPSLLRLADVLSALRAGGVEVTPIAGADTLFHLTFPGETPHQLLSLDGLIRHIDGVDYVDGAFLLDRLRSSVTVPLRITGLQNPVLSVGPARLQLGSSASPLLAVNLYLPALLDRLEPELPRLKGQAYAAVGLALAAPNDPDGATPLHVNTPDDTLYGLLSNADFTRPRCQCADDQREPRYSLSVHAARGGLLPAPLTSGRDTAAPKLVNSLPELFQATEQGQRALLVYRLNAADLRHLTYTPVPASQLKIQSP